MQELASGVQPHLVVVRGGESYCYTCDEDIEHPRLDFRCPREVKAEENRAYRIRSKETRQWGTV